MNYEPVIGIEVHVELNTKTKMFCRCFADYFGKAPNTHVCPVCLGLPGALPYINKEAIKKCIQIGLALNCEINDKSYFERKNYFYPDLAKGYQVSQLVKPLNINGKLKMENGKWIRINRVHQEEDTGKLTHVGGETLIDFNRCGVPLVEIVTEPDFTDSSQVKDYAKKLQQIFRYLGVSNADMEKGDMRLEANVSVRKRGSQKDLPPYRVELKNINSFRFMQAAIEYEIKRQIEALERGEILYQETRGWDEIKKETFLQRSKEEAHDYRYFPEPDIPELRIKNLELRVENIKKEMPELPSDKRERFEREYGLSKAQIEVLVGSQEMADFYEKTVEAGKRQNLDPKQIANHIINKKVDIQETRPAQIVAEISDRSAGVVSDAAQIEQWVRETIKENPKIAEHYKKGKEAALQVLTGVLMRKSSGKADARKAKVIFKKILI